MRFSLDGLAADEWVDFNLDTYGQNSPAIPVNTGFNWGSLFGGLATAGAGIAQNLTKVYATRNAVPQLQPGQSITQLANGTYQITQQPYGLPATGGSLSLGSGINLGGSLPLLIGVGVIAIVLMKGNR